jgi:hypothetical protein
VLQDEAWTEVDSDARSAEERDRWEINPNGNLSGAGVSQSLVETVLKEPHLVVLRIDFVQADEAPDDVSRPEGGVAISLIAVLLMSAST